MENVARVATKLVNIHEKYRRECLNLIASENVLSPAAKKALASDMASRYALRPEFYGGTSFIQQVWSEAETLGKTVFHADFCSVAPLSGHVALMMTLYSTVPRSSKIAAVDPGAAGYPGLAQDKIPEVFGFDVLTLPEKNLVINVDEAVNMLLSEKPAAVVLGSSLILYPMPVREIAEAVHSYGGVVIYDGSHVLGLIAGGVFQQPLKEGADVLLGSTHKSFFGPQGGIILTNDKHIFKKIEDNTFHKFVDNIHFNRVAALAVALDEARRHGARYAAKVVENAKNLAESLERKGLKPFKTYLGYTQSHQVFLPYDANEAVRVRDVLEKNYIIADMGVRLGTSEITRRGMSSKEMVRIAEFVARAISGENVSRQVRAFAKRFKSIKFV